MVGKNPLATVPDVSTLSGMAHLDPTQSMDTMPQLDKDTGLGEDDKVWLLAYVESTQTWYRVEATNLSKFT